MIHTLFNFGTSQDTRHALQDSLLAEQFTNANLRSQVRELSRKLRAKSRDGRFIQQAHADAVLLYSLWVAGSPISRDVVVPEILTRGRWRRAVELCRMARVHTGLEFSTEDAETVKSALQSVVNRLEIEGLDLLRRRLPARSIR